MLRTASLILMLALASCAGRAPPVMTAEQTAQQGYLLDSGDRLRITVFGEQNLTGEYNITSTGAVSFPLIGSVPAKGRTTDQLGAAITSQLGTGYINDPRVAVEVLTYRPYYIFGEVARPGEYPFVNGRTIEQAIAAAGGYTYRGNKKRVVIRRAGSDERLVAGDQFTARVLPGDTIQIGQRYF